MSEQKEIALNDEQISVLILKMLWQKRIRKIRYVDAFVDDKIVPVLKYHRIIDLDNYSLSTRRAIVKCFLINLFSYNEIYTVDGIKLTVTDNSASKLSRLTYNHQQEIAIYCDSLIEKSFFLSKTKSHKKRKGEFRYYVSYISFGKNIYSVMLNVFTDVNGSRLYDINKISQIAASGIVHGSSEINNIIQNIELDVKKPLKSKKKRPKHYK